MRRKISLAVLLSSVALSSTLLGSGTASAAGAPSEKVHIGNFDHYYECLNAKSTLLSENGSVRTAECKGDGNRNFDLYAQFYE